MSTNKFNGKKQKKNTKRGNEDKEKHQHIETCKNTQARLREPASLTASVVKHQNGLLRMVRDPASK